MTNSRRKGKRGEYIVRDRLIRWGFSCRRGILAAGEPDNVHNLPGNRHVETKNNEHLSIWAMLRQAERDATARGESPIVFFKKNDTKLYAALDADDLLELLRLQATFEEFKEINGVRPE